MDRMDGYYEYQYDFVAVRENEIDPKYKAHVNEVYEKISSHVSGPKAFLFLFETDFVVTPRPGEPTPGLVTLDSETFDAYIFPQEDNEKMNLWWVYRMTRYRLLEYWMSEEEIRLFCKKALAFATETAKKEYPPCDLTPVVVRFEVHTVQQEGEPFDAAIRRAIREKKLVPLYLWSEPTLDDPKRHIPRTLKAFLITLPRIRVESVKQGLPLMNFCIICKSKPELGDQITTLPHCNHAFHSHCVVQELVEDVRCPRCSTPAYPYKKPRIPTVTSRHRTLFDASDYPSVMYSNSTMTSFSESERSSSSSEGSKLVMLLMEYNCSNAIKSIKSHLAQGHYEQNTGSSMSSSSSELVSLMSSEGETFLVDKAAALKSPVLKAIIESSNSSLSIPLPDISSYILAKVIDYMNDPPSIEAQVNVKEFVSKFVKDYDLRMLCNLQQAASFLCIPLLPELTSMVISDKLKQSTQKEIRRDFTLLDKYRIIPKKT